jgi:cytochrome c-type biogenesis protein CcmF
VVVFALALPLLFGARFNVWIALAVLLSGWVAIGVLKDLWRRLGVGSGYGLRWQTLTPSFLGMATAHLGFASVVMGAVVVTQLNEERDLLMKVGDVEFLGGYRFELTALSRQAGPNYMADQAVFEITQGDKAIATLVPEKRRYFASGQMMTEAAIDGSVWRDLYIALGEPVEEGAWAVRLQFKPMVRWLWLGGALIGLGALLTVADRRYRRQSTSQSAAIAEATGLAG